MSKLRLIQHTECCPDSWRFTFRETGRTIRNFSWSGLVDNCKKYARDNDFAVPSAEEIEDQLCKLLPPGWCVYETGELPQWFLDARITLDDIINGTKVLGSFILEGMPLVDKETAASNGKICAGCYANVPAPGCGPCVGLANLVASVAGSTPLESDPQLEGRACLYCKCASRANIWVPVEISQRGVSDETLERMPDFCWKKNHITELRSSNELTFNATA